MKVITYTIEDIDSILMKIARRMKPTQTNDKNEIFAKRATFRYRQSGMTTSSVAKKITNSRLTKKFSFSSPVTRIRTFVTVSPTTTLYDTIAEIKYFQIHSRINLALLMNGSI
jgi:hypothetical protein